MHCTHFSRCSPPEEAAAILNSLPDEIRTMLARAVNNAFEFVFNIPDPEMMLEAMRELNKRLESAGFPWSPAEYAR